MEERIFELDFTRTELTSIIGRRNSMSKGIKALVMFLT